MLIYNNDYQFDEVELHDVQTQDPALKDFAVSYKCPMCAGDKLLQKYEEMSNK
jgi:hypothetical protein